jgi:uncharacterized protein (DUF433 family)
MPAVGYSPLEAAVVSGAPLAAIQKAITRRAIPSRAVGRQRRRQLDKTALLAFALVEALPDEVQLSAGTAYRVLSRDAPGDDEAELVIGDVVRIDTRKALGEARRRLELYDRARQLIVRDPAIMGGTPTIKGTRITAQSILGRVEGGDTIETVLEDYPYLDREAVEAAALYAKANPPRGRPSGKLWRRAS